MFLLFFKAHWGTLCCGCVLPCSWMIKSVSRGYRKCHIYTEHPDPTILTLQLLRNCELRRKRMFLVWCCWRTFSLRWNSSCRFDPSIVWATSTCVVVDYCLLHTPWRRCHPQLLSPPLSSGWQPWVYLWIREIELKMCICYIRIHLCTEFHTITYRIYQVWHRYFL